MSIEAVDITDKLLGFPEKITGEEFDAYLAGLGSKKVAFSPTKMRSYVDRMGFWAESMGNHLYEGEIFIPTVLYRNRSSGETYDSYHGSDDERGYPKWIRTISEPVMFEYDGRRDDPLEGLGEEEFRALFSGVSREQMAENIRYHNALIGEPADRLRLATSVRIHLTQIIRNMYAMAGTYPKKDTRRLPSMNFDDAYGLFRSMFPDFGVTTATEELALLRNQDWSGIPRLFHLEVWSGKTEEAYWRTLSLEPGISYLGRHFTSTTLRVPEGKKPEEFEESYGDKFWLRDVYEGETFVGRAYVPDSGRVIEMNRVLGIPAITTPSSSLISEREGTVLFNFYPFRDRVHIGFRTSDVLGYDMIPSSCPTIITAYWQGDESSDNRNCFRPVYRGNHKSYGERLFLQAHRTRCSKSGYNGIAEQLVRPTGILA